MIYSTVGVVKLELSSYWFISALSKYGKIRDLFSMIFKISKLQVYKQYITIKMYSKHPVTGCSTAGAFGGHLGVMTSKCPLNLKTITDP